MKGIILAGGLGTRLLPLTKVTNKHLLPIYDQPMIYYPIRTLTNAGITNIMIVTGQEHAGDFIDLLGNGKDFGAEFTYRLQSGPHGIADALGLCRDFAGNEPVAVILGDNIFENNFKEYLDVYTGTGAHVFLKQVADPERFGVATIEKGAIIAITEKPIKPETDLAVTGFYIYDNQVWDVIQKLTPSNRGELEITDVNTWYIKHNAITFNMVKGFWSDAGTMESLRAVNDYAKSKR